MSNLKLFAIVAVYRKKTLSSLLFSLGGMVLWFYFIAWYTPPFQPLWKFLVFLVAVVAAFAVFFCNFWNALSHVWGKDGQADDHDMRIG